MDNLWNTHRETVIEIGLELVLSVIIAVVGIFLSRAFKKLIRKASTGKTKIDDTASSILSHIVKYGIFIICVIMILNVFGVNTTSLLAVLGAAGLAVGLALKNTLGNIASGIILIFLRNYKIGEFIEFGAVSGTVKDINLFTTILETKEGVYISAPNSCIWGVPLRNHSRKSTEETQ